MRGLICAAMLAAVGCAGHRGQATSKKSATPPKISGEQVRAAAAEMAAVECAQERYVAAYLAARIDKALTAARAWRAKAIELHEKVEQAAIKCGS